MSRIPKDAMAHKHSVFVIPVFCYRRTSGLQAPESVNYGDRARRGASGALYPQSAIAGSNSTLEACSHRVCLSYSSLKTGFYAAEPCEPRQVRKEAAVSSQLRVP
jgi:hypothetical protein